jgi:hypothetical protein
MKSNPVFHPARRLSSATFVLALSLGAALAAGTLAAADATNTVLSATRGPVPTKLVVPPEWKVTGEPRDYRYEGLPLSEVTHDLQEQYKEQFDVLLPYDSAPVLRLAPDGTSATAEQIDVSGIAIKLRLKSVTLVEVFQAMNMQFELERKPFRWELVMNGRRPVAALHILDDFPVPTGPDAVIPADGRPQAMSRAVVFVGNLLAQPNAGGAGITAKALLEVLENTTQETFPASRTRKIQFHEGAELVVLTGTEEEVKFMKDVLQALTEKARFRSK